MCKKIFFTLLALPGHLLLFGQQHNSLFFLGNSFSSTKVNPALFPDAKVTINLPGTSFDLTSSSLVYNDLFQKNAEGGQELTMDKAIAAMDDVDNFLVQDFSVNTIGLGIRLGKFWISAHHASNLRNVWIFPRSLPQLIWQGNAQFIGQTVDFAPSVSVSAYNEWAVGLGAAITQNLRIGARVKKLNGVSNIHTDRSKLLLHTSDDIYQLQVEADFRVNTTNSLIYNDFSDISFNPSTLSMKDLWTQNPGWAYDIGIEYHTEKFSLSVSALDLGNIEWQDGPKQYGYLGQYSFQGLDVAQDILNDTQSLSSAFDSLKQLYQPNESALSYHTKLDAKYRFAANYSVADQWRIGLVAGLDQIHSNPSYFAGVGITANIGKSYQLGGSYFFQKNHPFNLGIHGQMDLGPLQIFAATHDFVSLVRLQSSRRINFVAGINLVLGKKEKLDKINEAKNVEDFF